MKKLLILALCSATLFTACKKGDTGPAGPAGSNGTNGTNGNANVKAGLITVTPSMWTWNSSYLFNYINITDNQITSDVVASGQVSVFVSSDNNTWYAMPLTFFGNPNASFNVAHSLNTVRIEYQLSNNSNSTPATCFIKVLAITSSQKSAHPKTNWNSYKEVQAVMAE